MDDRTFALVVAVLASSTVVVLCAGFFKFDVSFGFWGVPAGIISIITIIANRRKNGGPSTDEQDAEAARQVLRDYLRKTE